MAGTYCKTCKYFLIETNAQMGSCRRFPTYQNRHSTEWCGEFKVVVQHTDLPDTIDNLVAAAEKEENWGILAMANPQFIAEQEVTDAIRKLVDNPKNKGGRPRKVSRI